MCDHCEMIKDAEAKVEAAVAAHPGTMDYFVEAMRAGAAIKEAREWLDRVERAGCGCSHGKFYGRGYVENGVFKGHVGTCYRCGGKGYQTNGDRKRNWGYDQNRTWEV
jgi:hypothetical protein